MNSMFIQFAYKDQVYRRQLFGSYRHTIHDYKYSFLNILLLYVVVLMHYNVPGCRHRQGWRGPLPTEEAGDVVRQHPQSKELHCPDGGQDRHKV